jgi:Serine/threonine protein kinase
MEQSLPEGASVARYKIVELLAAGGMGEVYKAYDRSLDRHVALKILPPFLTILDERVRRFIQEAKAASSLNHPNIITIHEIGHAIPALDEKPSGEPVHYIAMELVDGQTLRQKIYADKRDLRSLLRLLAQAADGLARAHAAGIVHRDLKPDNIMVTRDGFAKVLDFGLAKLTEAATLQQEAVTVVMDKTREGVILGTVGYMAPEQVEAKAVDARADVFSFGCILYEAVTRQRPFRGASDIDVMHRILHDEPRPIAELAPEAPMELKRIVRRCLAKSPDERFQSIRDLALELRDLADEFPSLTPSSSPSFAAQLAGGKRTLWHSPLLWIAIGSLLTAAGMIWLLFHHSGSTHVERMKIKAVTTHGKVRSAVISPDGRYVAYVKSDRQTDSVLLKQIATDSEVAIMTPTSEEAVLGVAFSPDSDYLYLTMHRTGAGISNLFRIPALGGQRRQLASDVDSTASVSPDGKFVAFIRDVPPNKSSLIAMPADGGGETVLATRVMPDIFPSLGPSWSRDGNTIAAVASSYRNGLGFTILILHKDGSQPREILSPKWMGLGGLSSLPDGRYVACGRKTTTASQQLYEISPAGESHAITSDLNWYDVSSVTTDGKTLLAVQNDIRNRLWKYSGPTVTAITAEGDRSGPSIVRIAGDGSFIYEQSSAGNIDIWRMMPDGERRQLTTSPRDDYSPVVSADGLHVIFETERNGDAELWSMNLEGGEQRPIQKIGQDIGPAPSPDGKWLLYSAEGFLWRIPSAGGTPQKLAPYLVVYGRYSPDGQWIAGFMRPTSAPPTEPSRLCLMPAGGGVPRRIGPLVPRVCCARWTPDGKSVAYIRKTDSNDQIWAQPVDGSPAIQISHLDAYAPSVADFDWSRDGDALYVIRVLVVRDAVMITDFR